MACQWLCGYIKKETWDIQVSCVSEERLELSTNGLKGHCSAIELLALANGILTRTRAPVNKQTLPITSQNLSNNPGCELVFLLECNFFIFTDQKSNFLDFHPPNMIMLLRTGRSKNL